MPVKCPHNQTERCQMAFLWDGEREWCMCTYGDPPPHTHTHACTHTHHLTQAPIYYPRATLALLFHGDTFDIFTYTLSHLPTSSQSPSHSHTVRNTLTWGIELGSCPRLRAANIAMERARWEAVRINKAQQWFRKCSCKNMMLQSLPVHKRVE